MTMTKREKILILIVLALAVVVVYVNYLLVPRLNELKEVTDSIKSQEQSASTNDQIKYITEEKHNRMAQSIKEIESINKNILSDFDQPAVLYYLKETVSGHAQKIMFSFDNITDVGKIKVCPVKITMNGTYEGLKSILKALQEGEYFVKVVELDAEAVIPEDTGEDSPDEELSEEEVPAEPDAAPVDEFELNISLTLEFYHIYGDISPDKAYPFSTGYTYGGDIFF